MTATIRFMPKELEDKLFGQLDQRYIYLDDLLAIGNISDEVHETALQMAQDAYDSMVYTNTNSMSLGRTELDYRTDVFFAEIEKFDKMIAAVVAAKQALRHIPN